MGNLAYASLFDLRWKCGQESHDVAGGAAHGFHHKGFLFDAGPSLYSGMGQRPSTNPLGQVLHFVDAELELIKYDTWMCHLPEGKFLTQVVYSSLSRFIRDSVLSI